MTERWELPIVACVSLYITEDCINCGACDETCPVSAISEDVENSIRVIDPERCTECVGFYERTMCQVECPVECCLPDPERRETAEALFKRAKQLHPNHDFPSPPPSHFK
ncbi:MAG: YfhL family 4Fe-4S dicluster ferredoxin [Myxococcota bacterium]|nr:YfhL family 4Fe-4S dicluster ferredoxin [Myxococcota bacterium]